MADPGERLRQAALGAAQILGIPAALRSGRRLSELAPTIGAAPRRLRALLQVLCQECMLVRGGEIADPSYRSFAESPDSAVHHSHTGSASPAPTAPTPSPPPGSRLIATVLRRDQPVCASDSFALRLDAEYLAAPDLFGPTAGPAELADLLRQQGLAAPFLDAGCGHGEVSRRLLEAGVITAATLVDRPEILSGARQALGALAAQMTLLPGDLRQVPLPPGQATALLANVLHFHDEADAALIVRRVAAALAPGGRLFVKEVRLEEDQASPPGGVLFQLGLALFSDEGRCHSPQRLQAFLREAGLDPIERTRLSKSDDVVICWGRRAGASVAEEGSHDVLRAGDRGGAAVQVLEAGREPQDRADAGGDGEGLVPKLGVATRLDSVQVQDHRQEA